MGHFLGTDRRGRSQSIHPRLVCVPVELQGRSSHHRLEEHRQLANLSEYGYFDIYPSDDIADYNGNWCNYPFYPSGNVVLSGIEQGLFIVKPKFLPKVSANDVTVTEGNSGARNVTFTITLSAASTQNVAVNYSTSNGTATAGSGDRRLSVELGHDSHPRGNDHEDQTDRCLRRHARPKGTRRSSSILRRS